jgi:uncharacterized protein YndB with AHSA1/START domain
MAELKIERHFKSDPAMVFDFVTKPEHLAKWWGPEGMTLPQCALDFTKPGPWFSVMQNSDGKDHKVSGQITKVDPPNSVGFTWAWHDENDVRGNESFVTLTVSAGQDGGTDFTLHHQQLPSTEAADNHVTGWTSSLRKLERMAN